MDVAILTPISVEYNAVKKWLENVREEEQEGAYYTIGSFRGQHHTYQIALRETGSRNNVMALATEHIIRAFQPAVVILTGIAGGVKDVAIGDIVVATQAYGYEAGKATDAGFASRPNVLPYSRELLELAKMISRSKPLAAKLTHSPPKAKDLFWPDCFREIR